MMNIGRRTFIVLMFGATTCAGFLAGKLTDTEFLTIASGVIFYYFGGRKAGEK